MKSRFFEIWSTRFLFEFVNEENLDNDEKNKEEEKDRFSRVKKRIRWMER
jgi:hypothetical protein